MFRFKQFNVDQTGCAMKINTDGVLLGAIATAVDPSAILDIGTGTGVIALMLAQRFPEAKIDAVEIDPGAAQTALRNFKASPFADRLTMYDISFENYFGQFPGKKYDLIVSNPPFHINSLKSPGAQKALAKHTDVDFFAGLMRGSSTHLNPDGKCWLILPGETASLVKGAAKSSNLHLQKTISLHSFKTDTAHREIICFGLNTGYWNNEQLIIYDEPKKYSAAYRQLLREFLLIF